MGCEYCDIIGGEGKGLTLYEDERVLIAIRDHILTPGQVSVFPKDHLPIFEVVSSDLLGHCAILANAVSIVLFEQLGSKGTNILIRNGLGAGQNIPHFSLEVVPRQDTDGLALSWDPKPLMEDEMERVFTLLKDEVIALKNKKVVSEEKAAVSIEPIIKPAGETGSSKPEKVPENYLLKSIRRIP